MSLTDITVKSLKAPDNGQVTYPDETLPGFGVRVSQGGSKSFVLVHGRNRQRTTIGRYPIISLSDARTEAKRILAENTLGKHRPQAIKFEDALTEFLAGYKKKPSTVRTTTRQLNLHFLPRFRHDRLADIQTHQVAKVIDSLDATPGEARHAYAAIRLFFKWASRRQYVAVSPCTNMKEPSPPVSRERALTPIELAIVYNAADYYPYGTIVRLLILTGQRTNEIASLHASYIDKEARTITLPASLTKNNREHTFPIGKLTLAVLDTIPETDGLLFPARGNEERHFSGWSKCKIAFDKLAKLDPFTLHDLRRSLATQWAALGIPIQVTEKYLNHISGSLAGIVGVYNRHSYFKEMEAAVQTWERHMAKILKIR